MTGTKGMHSITRRKGLMKLQPPAPQWHVEITGYGMSTIRGADGQDPLRHPDALTRLRNVHLAASAPTLKEALILLLQRFESIHGGWHRDEVLAGVAWMAIYESRPTLHQEQKVSQQDGQYQFDLDEAA